MGDAYAEMYWKFKDEPFFGFYKLWKPTLMIRDPDLVKEVMVNKFTCFDGNDYYVNPEVDPCLGLNPFNCRGESWKNTRGVITRAVTGSKIKSMMPNIIKISKEMVSFLKDQDGEFVQTFEIGGLYTTDVVSCCAYSLRTNSFKDPDSEFRKMSANLFDGSFRGNAAVLAAFYAPQLGNILKWKILSDEATDYFGKLIKEAVEYRIKNNIEIDDLLQTLIDANAEALKNNQKPVFSDKEMASHCMTFSLDGFETGALLISFILYELSMNQEVQTKLRNEMLKRVDKIDDIEYDAVHNIEYLDGVVYECLRKHSPGTTMARKCNKEVTLESEGKSVTVQPGTPVVVPLLTMMNDPKNFPDPEKFIPDRFDSKSHHYHPYSHIPFGVGPRACPGKQFAMTMVKMAIISIMLDFTLIPKDEALTKIEEDPMYSFFHHSKCPIFVKFENINN